jgi:HD-GYP domain-containing protein (c-di-GMP phosphodiesterase class II)
VRLLRIEYVKTDMKLGRTIFAEDGRILLQRGTTLTGAYLDTLKRYGYEVIYVTDPTVPAVELREPISERTRSEAIGSVREAFRTFRTPNRKLDQDWTGRRILYNAATSILNDLVGNKDLNLQLTEMRTQNSYLFAHSVNVTVLGLALAQKLQFNYNKLADLAMGLLTHDIGKSLLPPESATLHTHVVPVEDAVYPTHARAGFDMLRQLGRALGAPSKIVTLQHHERWDGQGFPSGLAGNDIHEFAQIAAIVNAYDNLSHMHIDDQPIAPSEVIEFLMAAGGTHFNPQMVETFIKMLVPYPLGSFVTLSNRSEGFVSGLDRTVPMRPIVRVVFESEGVSTPRPYDLDLREHSDVTVLSVRAHG